MKKTTLIIIPFLLVSTFVHAQWANGTNIYNTNAGSVIIGATAPYTINASSVRYDDHKTIRLQ